MEKIQKNFDSKLEKTLSISCGGSVSVKPKEEKFKEADLALYKVKKTTKKGCKFYDELDYVKIEDI
jgi:GGDEF domain-containing protein